MMRRRDFLLRGILTAGALTAGRLGGTPTPTPTVRPANRAAVVIGVDKVGNLPILNAAASGARKIADWLTTEHFDVKLFVDDDGKSVHYWDLLHTVEEFIDRGTLEQLVVYFAGHGCVSSLISELWLLSDAHHDPNAAVSLIECVTLARESGIPNVVFISDACRSRPDSLGAQFLKGFLIFPIRTLRSPAAAVDRFLATRVGAAAYEYTVDKSTPEFHAIFTECFLDAFKHPYDNMVQTVRGERVIPNPRLEPFLRAEVPKRARAVNITLEQEPDCLIMSGEQNYIGHGPRKTRGGFLSPPPSVINPSVSDVAKVILSARGFDLGSSAFQSSNVTELAERSGFDGSIHMIQRAQTQLSETDIATGFKVHGERLVSAVTSRANEVTIRDGDTETLVKVKLSLNLAASVALRFANGSGTILAALNKYIGNVVVEGGKVTNVSYFPSPVNDMRELYQEQAQRLKQLHAIVATAARFGVFRIEGSEQTRRNLGEKMADQIRVLKGVDPTLGLYAAYAYADAGFPDQVRSVRGFMRENLRTDLFDVAMLTGVLSTDSSRESEQLYPLAPFCPMLSQGWGLLRVKRVRLPSKIANLQDHLQLSLWTTLDRQGMRIAEDFLQSSHVT